MVSKTFGLLFYLKKPKHYQKGPLPIYLRSVRKCGHNTTIKYLSNFKQERKKEIHKQAADEGEGFDEPNQKRSRRKGQSIS